MAVAVALDNTILPDPIDKTQQDFIVDGTLTLSGNYPNTHGDPINLAGLCPSNQLPTLVQIYQRPTAGTGPIHFTFLYGMGTTPANGVLIVQDMTTGLEIASGAYDATLTAAGANIRFRAWFPAEL